MLFYVVDSYGEIIKEDSISIEKSKWNNIQSAFLKCDIRNVEKRKIQKAVLEEVGTVYFYTRIKKSYFQVTNTDVVLFLMVI